MSKLTAFMLILFVSGLLLFFVGLGVSRPTAKFKRGDLVRIKISEDQKIGMIIAPAWYFSSGVIYDVRITVKRTEIPYNELGSGGPLNETEYQIVQFVEYELEKVEYK